MSSCTWLPVNRSVVRPDPPIAVALAGRRSAAVDVSVRLGIVAGQGLVAVLEAKVGRADLIDLPRHPLDFRAGNHLLTLNHARKYQSDDQDENHDLQQRETLLCFRFIERSHRLHSLSAFLSQKRAMIFHLAI